jgi:hypothetical protein
MMYVRGTENATAQMDVGCRLEMRLRAAETTKQAVEGKYQQEHRNGDTVGN